MRRLGKCQELLVLNKAAMRACTGAHEDELGRVIEQGLESLIEHERGDGVGVEGCEEVAGLRLHKRDLLCGLRCAMSRNVREVWCASVRGA